MKITDILGYKQSEMLVDASVDSDLKDLLSIYREPNMFEVFDDRLIAYMLAEAYVDGQTYGRSDDVIKALCFDDYYNGSPYDQERIQKQVKGILHKLYRARFIKRNGEDVYFASNIMIFRKYARLHGIVQIDIESTYEDGEFSIKEYHCIYEGNDFNTTTFNNDLSFVDTKKLGPIGATLILAHFLGDKATVSDFAHQDVLKELADANWLSILNDKVRLTGEFEIIGNSDTNKYRLIYNVN